MPTNETTTHWTEQARRWLAECSAATIDNSPHGYARAVGRAEAIIEGLLAEREGGAR